MTETAEKVYTVKTVETVHRDYAVQAASEEQAVQRAHLYFRDAGVLREGLVVGPSNEALQNRRVQGATLADGAQREQAETTIEVPPRPRRLVRDDPQA